MCIQFFQQNGSSQENSQMSRSRTPSPASRHAMSAQNAPEGHGRRRVSPQNALFAVPGADYDKHHAQSTFSPKMNRNLPSFYYNNAMGPPGNFPSVQQQQRTRGVSPKSALQLDTNYFPAADNSRNHSPHQLTPQQRTQNASPKRTTPTSATSSTIQYDEHLPHFKNSSPAREARRSSPISGGGGGNSSSTKVSAAPSPPQRSPQTLGHSHDSAANNKYFPAVQSQKKRPAVPAQPMHRAQILAAKYDELVTYTKELQGLFNLLLLKSKHGLPLTQKDTEIIENSLKFQDFIPNATQFLESEVQTFNPSQYQQQQQQQYEYNNSTVYNNNTNNSSFSSSSNGQHINIRDETM